jgi:hypothetical protein
MTCGVNWMADRIVLSMAALTKMATKQKFILSYTDADGSNSETHYISKPMVVNATNAAKFMPAFAANVCGAIATSYSVTAPTGTRLEWGSLHVSTVNGDGDYVSDNEEEELDGNADVINAAGLAVTGTPQFGYFYLSARDDLRRRFVRVIECQQAD